MTEFCRFCALKKSDSLDLTENLDARSVCLLTLEFLKVDFIDLSDNTLPSHVCELCYSSLYQAYTFFKRAEQSQTLLRSLFIENVVKLELQPELEDETPLFELSSTLNETDHPESISSCVQIKNEFAFIDETETIKLLNQKIHKAEALDSDHDDVPLHFMKPIFNDDNDKSWTDYTWLCVHCSDRFESLALLRSHSIQTHNTCYAFNCDDCNKTCHSFSKFTEHVRKHRNNLRFFCQYCNLLCKSVDKCIAHEKAHSEYSQICNSCGEIFTDMPTLNVHKKMMAVKIGPEHKTLKHDSDDELSNASFDEPLGINGEEIPPSDKEIKSWKYYPWICKICNVALPSVDLWRSHLKARHNKCAVFKCFDCDRTNYKRKLCTFIKHIGSHRKELRLQCYLCCKIRTSIPALRKHIAAHLEKYFCQSCGEKFTDEEHLRTHIQRYKPKRTVRLTDTTCKVCGKILKNKATLQNHLTLHDEEKYICDTCGKIFSNTLYLAAHMQRHERKYKCDVCEKVLGCLSALNTHKMIHTDDWPCSCDICGRRFRTAKALKSHQLIHGTSSPHVCAICHKAFKKGIYLKRHENQHTGVKPYKCKFCDRAFTNSGNCVKHIKRIHGTLL